MKFYVTRAPLPDFPTVEASTAEDAAKLYAEASGMAPGDFYAIPWDQVVQVNVDREEVVTASTIGTLADVG